MNDSTISLISNLLTLNVSQLEKKNFRACGAESFFFVLFSNAFRLHP
jgi:hypothetical protein